MSELNAIAANLSNNFTIDTVVVAAGVGKRFGSQMPKQYTHIGGQTVLQHSIAALSKVHQLSTCYLVISEEDTIAKTLGFSMPIEWVIGGKERWIRCLTPCKRFGNNIKIQRMFCDLQWKKASHHAYDNHWVLIHDAARPCVNERYRKIDHTDHAAIFATVASTVTARAWAGVGGFISSTGARYGQTNHPFTRQSIGTKTLDRSQLWLAQTPQIFPLATLYDYLSQAIEQTIAFTWWSQFIWAFWQTAVIGGRQS